MILRKFTILTILFLSIVFLGCRSLQPVLNIENSPVVMAGEPTTRMVERAIISATVRVGWLVNKKEKGHMIATLHHKSIVLKVDITYDTKSYSIKHKESSPNMRFDGINIHPKYNKYIIKLDRVIRAKLAEQ